MIVAGYLGAVVMGLSLGLIGGGGSILTVPILVYLLGVDAVAATAYSLFVVGATSLVGSFSHVRLGNIHWRTALVFGAPSIVAVFLTRLYVMPAIPNEIARVGTFTVTKGVFLLTFFAVLMLLAAWSMIRTWSPAENPSQKRHFNYPLILAEGLVVGVVTGLVGAGGGFLIIPALVLLTGLPMKQAVGTSLMIIAAKSLIGFLGDLQGAQTIDWGLLLSFSGVAILGIIAGTLLSKQISDAKLKPAFGWFVLVMGIYIIAKELFFQT